MTWRRRPRDATLPSPLTLTPLGTPLSRRPILEGFPLLRPRPAPEETDGSNPPPMALGQLSKGSTEARAWTLFGQCPHPILNPTVSATVPAKAMLILTCPRRTSRCPRLRVLCSMTPRCALPLVPTRQIPTVADLTTSRAPTTTPLLHPTPPRPRATSPPCLSASASVQTRPSSRSLMRRMLAQRFRRPRSAMRLPRCSTCHLAAFRSGTRPPFSANLLANLPLRFQNKRQSMRQTNRQSSTSVSSSYAVTTPQIEESLSSHGHHGHPSTFPGQIPAGDPAYLTQSSTSHRRYRSPDEGDSHKQWRGYWGILI